MNKYYKNFIMCGDIDYHCLLCVETFCTIEDVEKHIRWEKHRRILKTQAYFSKFRKEFIYKIGAKFYCEICNIVSSDVKDTTVHIKDELHAANKAKPSVEEKIPCKQDSGFVILSDIILTKEEWNAVIDRHCLICDERILALDRHLTTPEHVIKVIQAKVVKKNDNEYYRKINPNTIYCFTCKKSVSAETLSGHWEEKEHLQKKESGISRTSKDFGAVKDRKNENLWKVMEIQKILYDIDVKGGKATCKLCDKVVKFNFSEMMAHQEDHGNLHESDAGGAVDNITSSDEEVVFSEVTDHGKKRAELAKYGKKHNIKLNEGGSRGYCYTCQTHISAHIQVFKQHVRGWQHKGHLEYKGIKKESKREPPVYKTEPLTKYLNSVFHSVTHQLLWLNTLFSVDMLSFLFVAPINDVAPPKKIQCYACNIEYEQKDNQDHLKTAQHRANVIDAEVVTTLEGEFIREVAPNLYHCGFCNSLIAYYDNVMRHLRRWRHKGNKMNKYINSRLFKHCLIENLPPTFSNNPDVMYVQLMKKLVFTDA